MCQIPQKCFQKVLQKLSNECKRKSFIQKFQICRKIKKKKFFFIFFILLFIMKLNDVVLLLSLTHKWHKKYCFRIKFLKFWFWWIFTFRGLLNPKMTFLVVGLFVPVTVDVCYQYNSKTNLYLKCHISYSLFVSRRCYLKLLMKIGQMLYVQGLAKEFKNITEYGRNFFLVHLNVFRLH